MSTVKNAMYVALAATLLCVGCATSPEEQDRQQARQADIEDILSQSVGVAEFGETKRCLADSEYRNFRALGDRHIVFEGRGDRLWINTLRTRCPDLRYGYVLRVESFSTRRICDTDHFQVGDMFSWPWYRRWPWHWGRGLGSGITCTFGDFQPVTEGQVAEIEAVLKSQ